jgi:hypothetical protein
MTEIDTLVPRAAGGLLGHMIELARLRERGGHHDEPRRVLLDTISRQTLLLSRMSERLGVAVPQRPLMRAVMREVELGCLECTNWRRCRQWLDESSPNDDDYRDFCPNEGLFGVLLRQDNARRPCAFD